MLGEYLSDKVAPLMALDALTLLMELPPAFVAREVATWSVRQVEVQQGALAVGDLLFHAARKIHMMGDFGLIATATLDAYLGALGPLLLQACPPEEREALALGLSRLNESRQALASKVEIVHRQSGAPESVTRAAAASAQQAAQAGAPQVLSAVVQGLGRLPLLLRRLEQFALTRAAPAAAHTASAAKEATGATRGAPEAHLTAGRAALVADAVLEASLQAKDGPELEQHLERIRKLGVVAGTDEMFRALGRSVSGWTLPAVTDASALPEGGQVSAMRRMIALADEPAEAGRRFREMVHAAIEQFNEGSYGRSLKMFDLARQMVEEGQVKAAFVEPMVVSGHEYLAEERVRKLAERPESHFFLRPVLAFFRAYSPDRLLDELQAEQRRDRRRQLLNLLETHGTPARAAAWGRLQSDPEGRVAGRLLPAQPRLPAPDDPASRRHAVADRGGDRRAGAARRARAAALPGQGSAPVPGGEPSPVGRVPPRGAARGGGGGAPRADRVGRGSQGAADPPRPGGGGARAPRHPARVGRDRGARARPTGVVRRPPLEARGALDPGPVAGADCRRAARGGHRGEPAPRSARAPRARPRGHADAARRRPRLHSRAGSARAALRPRLALREPGLRPRGAEDPRRARPEGGGVPRRAFDLRRPRPLRPAQPAPEPLGAREDGRPQPPRRERPPGRGLAPRGRRDVRRAVRRAQGAGSALPAHRAALPGDVRLRPRRASGGAGRREAAGDPAPAGGRAASRPPPACPRPRA